MGLFDRMRAAGMQVEVSPDLDDYASGRKSAHEVRCVKCKTAPCSCAPCTACGWIVAPGQACPRGCE